jgi:hypothetical protein
VSGSNYVFKPTAELSFRDNRTLPPRRLNTALGIKGGKVRARFTSVLACLSLAALCEPASGCDRPVVFDSYDVKVSALSGEEQLALFTSISKVLGCLVEAPELDCGLKLNVFKRGKDGEVCRLFSGGKIERIWMPTESQVIVEFPWPDEDAGGVLSFGVTAGNYVPVGATLIMP